MIDADPLVYSDLAERLKGEALRLGFDKVGIARADAPEDFGHYLDWLARGDHAGLGYMEKNASARENPSSILEGVRSVVMVSLVHGRSRPENQPLNSAKIAAYAQGADYHAVLWGKLNALLAWIKIEKPEVRGRGVSDTAPLLERDFARRAGLGWIGKNTLLIDTKLGSFTMLGALLLDLELTADAPFEKGHCGTCTRCLDACPTDAFRAPYQLDARKCLSYWTIEHKDDLSDEMAEALGDWVFGCDVCQEVCPWNRKAKASSEPLLASREEWSSPDLLEWLRADPADFSARLKGTALSRTKRRGLIRNALHILGNRREKAAEADVGRLLDDPEPVIRRAAAWALRRIKG